MKFVFLDAYIFQLLSLNSRNNLNGAKLIVLTILNIYLNLKKIYKAKLIE